jgi:hypothetical protein
MPKVVVIERPGQTIKTKATINLPASITLSTIESMITVKMTKARVRVNPKIG